MLTQLKGVRDVVEHVGVHVSDERPIVLVSFGIVSGSHEDGDTLGDTEGDQRDGVGHGLNLRSWRLW